MRRGKPSSLNNGLDIEVFPIEKHRSEGLRKLTYGGRSTSCNQNLRGRSNFSKNTSGEKRKRGMQINPEFEEDGFED